MLVIKFFVLSLLVEIGAYGNVIPKEEYYSEGYLSDCPGSTKPAFIKRKTLKHLGIVVVGGAGTILDYQRTYNYYQVEDISKDPNLDLKNKKTIFFFCGFLDSPKMAASMTMAMAYRSLGYNVLLMEAQWFLTVHYPIASRFVPVIGKHFAEMLANVTDLDPKRLEFAGLSLGAQILSHVAKNYQHITGRNVSKLIGLDPAGPCFRNLGPEWRIDASDADFVLIISTNIDGFGTPAPVGHVNFYINGGEYQPSDGYFMPCTYMCSHVRAYMIWLSALYSPNYFIGLKCDSVEQARKHQCFDRVPKETNVISNTRTDKNQTGIFYVTTDNNWPYYMGSKGLRKENLFFPSHLTPWNKPDLIEI